MRGTDKKVGLALGGGGVRGLSHIGVLHILEQEGVEIDLIVGTSAGSLIGGAYASGQSPKEIQTKIDTYLISPEFDNSSLKSIGISFSPTSKTSLQKAQYYLMNRYYLMRAFFRPSLLPAEDFKSLINYLLPDIDIKDTRIPFYAVATDLITGKEVIISKGSLREAVLASASVPGAVEPLRRDGKLLADGSIVSTVPVKAARDVGAEFVIAVMVGRDLPIAKNDDVDTATEILYRAGEITSNRLEELELSGADIVIRPQVGDLHWADFTRSKDLVKNGENACRESIRSINEALKIDDVSLSWRKRVSGFLKRLLGT
ncbi:MAG: patatin-like phospholipase family protein [Syntrophaceae bacterium]|nr:patatin-like phospholipase family protein [Syntrophaceae bacterium]